MAGYFNRDGYVACDAPECNKCYPDLSRASGLTITEARKEAKQNGWEQRRIAGVMVDLCPFCVADRRAAIGKGT